MAYQLPSLMERAHNATGLLSGAKRYVFLAETETLTDFFTDEDLSVTHANPQIADSAGLFAAAFFAAGTYKIRYTDSAGTTLYETDNYVVETDGSALEFPVVVKTANFSVSESDQGTAFLVDASGAPGSNITVSADSDTLGANFPFWVVDVGASGTVTIQGAGAQTVDGAATATLNAQYSSIGLVSIGAAGWVSLMKSNTGTFDTAATFNSSISFGANSYVVGGPLVQPMGRLTLTTAVPVLSSDVTAQTTVFFTPYMGNRIALPNGSGWSVGTFTEVSQTLADATKSPAAGAASSVYDMFGWNDSGTFRVTRGPAWSSATSRGTGAGTSELDTLNGVLVNKVAITNGPAAGRGVYLGTIGTSASGANGQLNMMFAPASAAGGTANRLDVWNMYNRVTVAAMCRDNTNSWNYTTATWRAMNNNNSNRITIVRGLQEDIVSVLNTQAAGNSSNVYVQAGIGLDVTNSPSGAIAGSTVAFVAGTPQSLISHYRGHPGLGSHFFQALEWSTASGTTTWSGDNNADQHTGMTLEMRA